MKNKIGIRALLVVMLLLLGAVLCACGLGDSGNNHSETTTAPVTTTEAVTTTTAATTTAPLTPSEGLSFTSNGDGTCYVADIGDCTDTAVVIPAVSPAGDTVTGIGEYAFLWSESLLSITIPGTVESIGDFACHDCPVLTKIIFTEGSQLKSIGTNALTACPALTEIRMPADNPYYQTIDGSLYTKDGKTLLRYATGKPDTHFEIPGRVESIGMYAFVSCPALASVAIPATVKSIGERAFSNCSSLAEIAVAADNPYYQTIDGSLYTKDGEILLQYAIGKKEASFAIPSGVTEIGAGAFSGCTALSELVVSEGVATIGDNAFWGCSSLSEITLPASVTSIGAKAFSNCTSLTSIAFAEGSQLTSIGAMAFGWCTSLTEITLPDSLTSIGESVFTECSALSSITIPSSVTSIGSGAFHNCTALTTVAFAEGSQLTSIGAMAFGWCTSLTEITLPASVTSIGGYAFQNCTSLTSIAFAEGSQLTSIGAMAFADCTSLTEIIIPEGVTTIERGLFYYCTALGSVTIPASVERIVQYIPQVSTDGMVTITIGESAFEGCTSLSEITVASGNQHYQSIDGNLYTKDGKTLVQYAVGKSDTHFEIPDTVESINTYAFRACHVLTEVVIPDTVTSIGYRAFTDCPALTVFCEAAEQPGGWNSYWNFSCPVVWGASN